MKKTLKILSLVAVLAVAITAFAGCDFINGLFGGEDTTATVTWYNGTEVLKTEEVTIGGTVKTWTPDAPAGQRFYAWYKDAAFTKMFNFNDTINEDTSIYAAFVAEDFVADTTQYYLIGEGVGDLTSSNWDHNNSMYDFALVNQNVPGANVFSITISMYAGDKFQICHDGVWDGQVGIGHMEGAELNEAGDYATVKDEYGIDVFVAPANQYHADFKQWDITLADGQDGVYQFTYTTYEDATQNVITWKLIEKLDAGSAPTAACDIYFSGTFNDWSTSYEEGSEYHLYDNENGTWEGNIIIEENMYADWTLAEAGTLCAALKLYDAANDAWISYNGGNLFVTAGVYRIVYTVATNSFVCEILKPGEIIEGGSGSGSTSGPVTWYVRGTMNNWGAEADYKLVYDEDGNASITLSLMAGETFKVADATWTEGNQFNASHISGNPNFKEAATEGNIEVVVGGTYTITVTAAGGFKIVGEGEDAPVDPVEPVEPTEITLYYYSADWTSVNLYAFADNTPVGDSWPGTAMTAVEGEDGWYSITLTVSAEGLYVIFNDGESQTSDLAYTGLNYWVGEAAYETLEAAKDAIENPVVTPVQLYVKGTMNNWSDNADYALSYDNNGNAYMQLSLAVGDIFKVANSDWSVEYKYVTDLGGENLKEGAANQNIEVVVAGTYTITVTAEGTLVIELVEASEPTEPTEPSEPTEETVVYLVPNDNWNVDGARFAAYMWNDNGDNWVDFAKVEGEDNLYVATIPAGYTNIIFCRMNPGESENTWDNKWNQTGDLELPTDGSNCYTVAADTWDNGNGTWSVYTAVVETPEE